MCVYLPKIVGSLGVGAWDISIRFLPMSRVWKALALAVTLGVVTAAGGIGKSTYAMTDPFAYKDFMELYLPTAENKVEANS
jgi:hypothetical protein